MTMSIDLPPTRFSELLRRVPEDLNFFANNWQGHFTHMTTGIDPLFSVEALSDIGWHGIALQAGPRKGDTFIASNTSTQFERNNLLHDVEKVLEHWPERSKLFNMLVGRVDGYLQSDRLPSKWSLGYHDGAQWGSGQYSVILTIHTCGRTFTITATNVKSNWPEIEAPQVEAARRLAEGLQVLIEMTSPRHATFEDAVDALAAATQIPRFIRGHIDTARLTIVTQHEPHPQVDVVDIETAPVLPRCMSYIVTSL